MAEERRYGKGGRKESSTPPSEVLTGLQHGSAPLGRPTLPLQRRGINVWRVWQASTGLVGGARWAQGLHVQLRPCSIALVGLSGLAEDTLAGSVCCKEVWGQQQVLDSQGELWAHRHGCPISGGHGARRNALAGKMLWDA